MNGFHHNEVGSVKKNEVGDTYKDFDIDNHVEHMLENIGKDHFRGNFDIDKCLDEMFDEFKCEMPDIDTIVREYLNKGYNHDFKQHDIDVISSGPKLRMPNIREHNNTTHKLPIEQSMNCADRNQSEITGKEENIPHYEKVESTASIETTREQSIEQQDKVIDEVDSGDKELETDQEKGNYGEMKTDQDLRKRGYERISKDIVTSLDNKTHKGIDGVYYNENGNPQYIIVDAKYGKAQLRETQDGKQMSETWINNRLDQSIGKERADEIRLEKVLNPDNVGSYVSHIDSEGNVTYDKLDENGNVIEKDVNVND